MSGWVKLHRQLLSWQWYSDIKVTRLFIHCILVSNFEDTKWRGIDVKKGSFISSFGNLSVATGLTVQEVRTATNKLKSTNDLTSEGRSEYTVFTVVNYEIYQEATSVATNEQQANNKRSTSDQQQYKNNKNIISKEDIEDRKLKFAHTLEPFLSKYGRPLLNDFYKYWTEPNKSNTRFKMELEKTWSLERRLETWAKNDKSFGNVVPNLFESNIEKSKPHNR